MNPNKTCALIESLGRDGEKQLDAIRSLAIWLNGGGSPPDWEAYPRAKEAISMWRRGADNLVTKCREKCHERLREADSDARDDAIEQRWADRNERNGEPYGTY